MRRPKTVSVDASAEPVPRVCQDCRVRHDGICAVLSAAELRQLAGNARHTRHEAGEGLVIESGEISGYANVTNGAVKLSRVLRDGRQQLVGLQFAPDLIGRLFRAESPLTAEAASAVELCRFPKVVLEALVATSASLKQRLLDQSLQDLDDARDWMVTLGRKSAAEKVASVLLLIAQRSTGPDSGDRVAFDLPIGRADMADFLGLTIETVSRQISKLRHDGVISVAGHRRVEVLSVQVLKDRAG
jgi:CRP/FNR family transcriptional regulator, anaerobic regulatory protein